MKLMLVYLIALVFFAILETNVSCKEKEEEDHLIPSRETTNDIEPNVNRKIRDVQELDYFDDAQDSLVNRLRESPQNQGLMDNNYHNYYNYNYNEMWFYIDIYFLYYWLWFYGFASSGPVKGKAEITAHPHVLQLGRNGEQFCGASVISDNWALTAAHCLFETAYKKRALFSLTLRAGTGTRDEGGKLHRIARSIIHPSYKPGSVDFDIALLKVQNPFKFSGRVKPAKLPLRARRVPVMKDKNPANFMRTAVKAALGSPMVVSGFGDMNSKKSPENLQHQMVRVVRPLRCKALYEMAGIEITDNMLCVDNAKSSLVKIPGSPLVQNGTLMGVMSFGTTDQASELPVVFTSVTNLVPWIKAMTKRRT